MGEEAVSLHDHPDRGRVFGGGSIERDLDDRAEVRRGREVFAHGQQAAVLHAQASMRGTGGGEGDGVGSDAQTVHPLVCCVDEEQRAVLIGRPGASAVLVHARARTPGGGEDFGAGRTPHRHASLLGGYRLTPPDLRTDEAGSVDARRGGRDGGRGEGRGPGTVGGRRHASSLGVEGGRPCVRTGASRS